MMSTAMGGPSAEDAPLTQALDSFDHLTLQRDRQRRRVTEEENAVRCLEDLLKEKQRELEQLAREADSRADELAALERRVPALEDTYRGARGSLQMLTQMRDMLNNQLESEKKKTEEMLKTLNSQLEEAAARWEKYEAIYLTMPAYQRKLERDSIAAEERQLNERKEKLEAELNSRVSDRDFCVRLAECWTQARLLEGAIRATRGGGGDNDRQSPDEENDMSGACSQGFSTPRASFAPSPVSDMETGQEPEGGGSQPEPQTAVGGSAEGVEKTSGIARSPTGRDPELFSVAGGGNQTWQAAGVVRTAAGPGWGAEADLSIPQKSVPPPPQHRQEVSPSQASAQDRTRLEAPPQAMPGLHSRFPIGAAQELQQSPQKQQQSVGRSQASQPDAGSPHNSTQNWHPPTEAGQASQTASSAKKSSWSSAEPREQVPSQRRSSSFLIQMPSLYQPSRPRAVAGTDGQTGYQLAVPAPPPVRTPSQYRPPVPKQQPPPPPQHPPRPAQDEQARHQPSPPPPLQQQRPPRPEYQPPPPPQRQPQNQLPPVPQDVEMTEVQEVPQSSIRFAPTQLQADGAESNPDKFGRSPQRDGPREMPSAGRQSASGEEQKRQPPPASPERSPPPKEPRLLDGNQYWMTMPPETPDQRRNFVQQLRESPELARRPPPTGRPAQTARPAATPSQADQGHQFLRPAVPPPRRPAPPATEAQRSIFDTPRQQVSEPASPQLPPYSPQIPPASPQLPPPSPQLPPPSPQLPPSSPQLPPPSPQRSPVTSSNRVSPQPAPPSTPRPPAPRTPSEPATPVRPPTAAGDAPRSMAGIFASPEADVGQMDSGFSLFGGGPAGKEALAQQPASSSMSLFGAGDVGGDGDQGAEDFSFSFFSGGPRGAEKEASGGGGVFSFF